MILPIVKHPNPKILQVPCKEIDKNFLMSEEIQELIPNMIETMYSAKGVGLAAPQIGKTIRVTVINKDAFPRKIKILVGEIDVSHDLVLVNPVWDRTSRKSDWETEGCLSIPKVFGDVKRYKYIKVDAWDQNGKKISFDASNFFARVIQHEVDHLDGILFIEKGKDIYEVE